jgi:hypothetical protein
MRALACLLSLFASALLAGCVSVQNIPLTPAGVEALRGREASFAARDKPEFAALTPGKGAVGGLIGGALTIVAGNRIVEEHKIEDPALSIARAIGAELGQAHQVRWASSAVRVTSDEVAQLAKDYPAADLVLDVRTINWSFVYFPTNWKRYRVIYSARLRLIDVKQSRVLAEGFCARNPEETPAAPTYDELLRNGAEGLKRELKTAADFCVQHFRSATFAFAGQAPLQAAPAAVPTSPASAPPTPSVSTQPVASIAPTTALVPTTRFPQPGDSWTYRLIEPRSDGRGTQRNYVVRVAAASPANILDQVSPDGAPPSEWAHSGGSYFVTQGLPLFSPYLAVFEDLTPGTSIRRIAGDDACAGWYNCVSEGKVVGRETVQLPAGSFDAIKVTIEQHWTSRPGIAAGGGRRTLTIWYSPQAKRAVKFSNRATGGSRLLLHTNFDLELVSYQLK